MKRKLFGNNMTDYCKMTDSDLCALAAEGDREAEDILIQRYSVLVKKCARPYFLAGGDSEDLMQEGFLGLLSAVRQYDESKTASFKTFAELCIRNRLYSAVRSAARFKHTPLNDYISFASPNFDEGQTRSNTFLRDPETLIIAKEWVDELYSALESYLSPFERSVMVLYLEGFSYNEISQTLNKPVKSIDNAVQRIRKKLAKNII